MLKVGLKSFMSSVRFKGREHMGLAANSWRRVYWRVRLIPSNGYGPGWRYRSHSRGCRVGQKLGELWRDGTTAVKVILILYLASKSE